MSQISPFSVTIFDTLARLNMLACVCVADALCRAQQIQMS